jgi:hypothetical protein
MEKSEIILFVAVFIFAGFRLYQKYVKKNEIKPGEKSSSTTTFPTSVKEDDYEPYSKK